MKTKIDVTIIVDASFCSISGAGGYAAWIKGYRAGYELAGQFKTVMPDSATAETAAIANALDFAVMNRDITKDNIVLIQTDCLEAIRYLEDPEFARIRTKLREIINHVIMLKDNFNLSIKYRHVKGHTEHTEQDNRLISQRKCDKSARKQMRIMRKKLTGYKGLPNLNKESEEQ